MPDLLQLFAEQIESGASDLHVVVESSAQLRIEGSLVKSQLGALSAEEIERGFETLLPEAKLAELRSTGRAHAAVHANSRRFRAQLFWGPSARGGVFRLIPEGAPSFKEQGLPDELCHQLCALPTGLIVVSGRKASGRSSSVASFIQCLNRSREARIVTFEDPIEFVHSSQRAMITQIEPSWGMSSVKRLDADMVVLELSSASQVHAALDLVEGGHLVLATANAIGCIQTVQALVGSAGDRGAACQRVGSALEAVFCSQLVPRQSDGKRLAVVESLVATPAARNLILEDKLHQLSSLMMVDAKSGMRSMDMALMQAVQAGDLSIDTARAHGRDPALFKVAKKGLW
jgi:twitching motility protein PilT